MALSLLLIVLCLDVYLDGTQLILVHHTIGIFFWSTDGKHSDAAALFQKVSESVKVKRYSEALDDLKAAIEADPALSEAYWHRASILRQLCRYFSEDLHDFEQKLIASCHIS